MKTKYQRILIEFFAWTTFFVFQFLFFSNMHPFIKNGSDNNIYLLFILVNSYLLVFYYVNFYYLVPRFFFRKEFFKYFLSVFLVLLILIVINLHKEDFNPLHKTNIQNPVFVFLFGITIRFISVFLLSLAIATFQRKKQLEKINLKSEISTLKLQINPHFLFNTLNNIYALVLTKSDLAAEAVTRLSSIMRYMVYESVNDYVSIEDEINYIKSYIELEKLRLTNQVNLEVDIRVEQIDIKIAPMLFLPFIENAFKHGVSNIHPTVIKIKIDIDESNLILKVSNTKANNHPKEHSGFGINNFKSRLDLLYPNQYQLNIIESKTDFTVKLKLKLHA